MALPDGVDTVRGIDYLEFSNKTVSITDYFESQPATNPGNDTLTGTDNADLIWAGPGDDVVAGMEAMMSSLAGI